MRHKMMLVAATALLCGGLAACSNGPKSDNETSAGMGVPPAAAGGTSGTAPGALRATPSDSPVSTGAGGGSSGGASGGASGGKAGGGGGT